MHGEFREVVHSAGSTVHNTLVGVMMVAFSAQNLPVIIHFMHNNFNRALAFRYVLAKKYPIFVVLKHIYQPKQNTCVVDSLTRQGFTPAPYRRDE